MNAVTGVFSFTGGYIARALLADGERVRTLSRRPEPGHPLAGRVEQGTLQFRDRRALAADLRGADTLYNTYWIRFPREGVGWQTVLENTRRLLDAAAAAGVRRVVQVSVSNASERSPLPYYRAKALAERAVRESGLSYAIIRPTLIFGDGDVLFNNIAWALRRLPVFPVPGRRALRVQPVAGWDVAAAAVAAARRDEPATMDAAGPAVYKFAELVRRVGAAIGVRRPLIRVPRDVALAVGGAVARIRGDELFTREELRGLAADLLVSRAPPAGRARLEEWLSEAGGALGRAYVSERERNWRP